MKECSEVRIAVLHQEMENRQIMDRARQHMAMQNQAMDALSELQARVLSNDVRQLSRRSRKKVRMLSNDVRQLSRRSREKVDALSDLQQRIGALRDANLFGAKQRPWADRTVELRLREDLSAGVEPEFGLCSRCGDGAILLSLLPAHELTCTGPPQGHSDSEESEPGGSVGKRKSSAPAQPRPSTDGPLREMAACEHCGRAFLPAKLAVHAPRCKARSATAAARKRRSSGTGAAALAQMPPREVGCDFIQLAWQPPIIDGGCLITEHEISYDMVTEVPAPHKGRNAKVGPDWVCITWRHPAHVGGSPLKGYCIGWSEVVMKEVPHEVEVGVKQRHTLEGLRGSTPHRAICIWAVNEAGLAGPCTTLAEDVITLPPSRKQLLADELRRAEEAKGEWIDADLYKGFVQRERRDEYIIKLKRDLEALKEAEGSGADGTADGADDFARDAAEAAKKAAEAQREKEQAALKLAQDEAIIEGIYPGFKRRREQYQHRLRRLAEDIAACEERRIACIGQRAVLSQQLGVAQARMLHLQAEADRVAHLKGSSQAEVDRVAHLTGSSQVNSSVMHGADQRFSVKVLRHKLRDELELCRRTIASDKAAVMEGNSNNVAAMRGNRLAVRMTALREKRAGELKERTAAFALFNRNIARALSLGTKATLCLCMYRCTAQVKPVSDLELKRKYFALLLAGVREVQGQRATILNALLSLRLRRLSAAMYKWRTGRQQGSELESDYDIRGAGGRLLLEAETARLTVKQEAEDTMTIAVNVRRACALASYTAAQRRRLEGSKLFDQTELGGLLTRSAVAGRGGARCSLAALTQGDGFMKNGDYARALSCYQAQIADLGQQQGAEGLAVLGIAYGRLGAAYLSLRRVDHSLLMCDRQLELATEAEHQPGVAAAKEGLARGYMQNARYGEAAELLRSALEMQTSLSDAHAASRLRRHLETCQSRLGARTLAQHYADSAAADDNEFQIQLDAAKHKLELFRARLVNQTASDSKASQVVKLERVTATCVRLRHGIVSLGRRAKDAAEQHKTQRAATHKLEEAKTTDRDTMSSLLIHEGEEMVFEIEEFKTRLAEREAEVALQLQVEHNLELSLANRITNIKDETEAVIQDIAVEEGDLMRSTLARQPLRFIALNTSNTAGNELRFIALNTSNTAGNEVEGTATGGVERVVAAAGRDIFLHSLATGQLLHVFSGDQGHSGVITCLALYKSRIYSGSADCTVQAWDVETCKRALVLAGHEATVCCIAADETKVVSGGADRVVIVGGADGDIRMWSEKKDGYECMRQMRATAKGGAAAHRTAVCVTCVAYGALELVSGHADGAVVVWWVATGMVMLRVVSGGADAVVAVTDLTTGEPIMSLRGHTAAVASADGTLRYWSFVSEGGGAKQDRMHVMERGDNLAKVAKKYAITLQQLLRWNGIRDARQVGIGARLVVTKGDPTAMTAAEAEMLEHEARVKRQNKIATIIIVAAAILDMGAAPGRSLAAGGTLIHAIAPDARWLRSCARTREAQEAARLAALRDEASVASLDASLSNSSEPAVVRHLAASDWVGNEGALAVRIAHDTLQFGEMWDIAGRLHKISTEHEHTAHTLTLAGRMKTQIAAAAREAMAFELLKDEAPHAADEGEEEVLKRQARELAEAAADVADVLMALFVGEIVKALAVAAVYP
ncbi:hypothetical protein JKP88DRAFT_283179 [Tribonema minus]|uniref:Uncharacterized protein n=1 Tax=Tribonema minus TaxID=303371 RepID=A0A835YLC2_9STRA|nr:hypothetical protein JKP88DRAFT_283179 [Tribonema minus]